MSFTSDTIRRLAVAQTTIATPLGPLLLVRTHRGLAGAWFDGQRHHPGPLDAPRLDDDALLQRAARQLAAYFDGRSASFDVPLDLHGTPFQRRVWQALLAIAPGATSNYGRIAMECGAPRAVRAVGAAVGRNPLSVVVPCHRVLGADGSLTGYAGGLDRKRALLDLEARDDAARVPSSDVAARVAA